MQTTITFANGDQVTSAKFNEIISGATFTSSDINGTTLAVVGGKLQVNVLVSSNYGSASINTSAIANDAVTSDKIANGAVTNNQLGNLSISPLKIQPAAVDFSKFSPDAIASASNMRNEAASKIVQPSVVKEAPTTLKAYGGFNITGTGRAIQTNSYNVASLLRLSSTQTRVTLSTPMSGVNYFVIPVVKSTTSTLSCTAEAFTPSQFIIYHPAEAADRAINFAVMGIY